MFQTEHPKPTVRPYTKVEREAMHFEPGETAIEKARRLVVTHQIDTERFQEATSVHPDNKDHYDRLTEASFEYTTQVVGRMITEGLIETANYSEIGIATALPYGGTEKPIHFVQRHSTAPGRFDLVA